MSVRDPEDKKLLEDCFAQDKQAWDTFVERYSRLISSAIVKTLRKHSVTPDEDLIEELFHTVFLVMSPINRQPLDRPKALLLTMDDQLIWRPSLVYLV